VSESLPMRLERLATTSMRTCPGCCNCSPSNYTDPMCDGDGARVLAAVEWRAAGRDVGGIAFETGNWQVTRVEAEEDLASFANVDPPYDETFLEMRWVSDVIREPVRSTRLAF
jgi:hypothetical protein